MTTVKSLISCARAEFADVRLRYVHPVLYLLVVDERFSNIDDDARIEIFASKTGFMRGDLLKAMSELELNIVLLDSAELEGRWQFLLDKSIGSNWLPLFDDQLREEWSYALGIDANVIGKCRPIHFYGFKGGQARSTVMAVLGSALADSGFRVLLVDADIEAPSLHLAFNAPAPNLSGSLMGVLRGLEPQPVPLLSSRRGGALHLLPTVPSMVDFEMDYASFVLRTTLDSSGLSRGIGRLKEYCDSSNYDFALIDHRTGLSTTVLPIIGGWPGSVVINTRGDGLSESQEAVVSTLLAANSESPGAFVCFSLDPEKRTGVLSSAERSLRDNLLSLMVSAVKRGADSDYEIGSEDLLDYFLLWYHDRAFLERGIPDLDRISKDNLATIEQLRQVLSIPARSKATSRVNGSDTRSTASPSGALDAGWFVETPDATRLLEPTLPSSYVFGRKGTGKTRLFREICDRGLAAPLHSAVDYKGGGVQAQSSLAAAALQLAGSNLEGFWWILLHSFVYANKSGANFESALGTYLQAASNGVPSSSEVAELLRDTPGRLTFAIDGVETAVEAGRITDFVESLFRFLSTLQNDPLFSEKIRFRLFIRSDLPVGVQNIEQQIHGRRFNLRWDEDSIFHYVLAEIARTPWFRSNFTDVCAEIDGERTRVSLGELSSDEYISLLLRVFPQKLRRNNISTITFFRTYFSDAAGEGDSRSSFYPRVFGTFLSKVADLGEKSSTSALDVDQRVSHTVVLDAFEFAAREFINEVKQELNFALNLDSSIEKNRKLVGDLISSFSGLQTPFNVDRCAEALGERLPQQLTADAIRESLRRMKEMGIFEDHPKDATKWRAGRLFKEGLRMKYVR